MAVLFSGGKDSAYAAYIARQRGEDLACLITLQPMRQNSYMFHYPNVRWTELQARAMHLPQIIMETPGVKEEELAELAKAIGLAKEKHGIQGVYSGALASSYQKTRVEKTCSDLGLAAVSPLWHTDPVTHLSNLIKEKFTVIITGAAALGLDESWLGRMLDEKTVRELAELSRRYGVHAGLEGGEGETFVLDCPLFDRRIEVLSSRKHWERDAGYLEILDARLVPK